MHHFFNLVKTINRYVMNPHNFQDLRYLQEDSTRRKTNFLATIKEKDEEIATLQDQLARNIEQKRNLDHEDHATSSGANTSTMQELETRLGQLTDSLLQKQALLERVMAERTAMHLKMERMEVKSFRVIICYCRDLDYCGPN